MSRPSLPQFLVLAAAILVGSSGALRGATLQYTITCLGDLGAPAAEAQSLAYDINSHGQVTGSATVSDGTEHAFLYAEGKMRDLGSLPASQSSAGMGINDQGVVVGNAGHAFSIETAVPGAKMVDLGELPNGSQGSGANGINDAGVIVGGSFVAGGESNAFLCPVGGTMVGLGDLLGPSDTSLVSIAYGINRGGTIVGEADETVSPFSVFPMVYTGGTMMLLPQRSGDTSGVAEAINASGEAVGQLVNGGAGEAMLWTGAGAQGLGFLSPGGVSDALGINDAGQIVGSATNASNVLHAFIYMNGVMTDLNSLIALGKSGGFSYLATATAINSDGTIVGYGPHGSHGNYFGFMATPNIPTVVKNPGRGALVAFENGVAVGLGGSLAGSQFGTFGPPAIDMAGDVAFHAILKAPARTKPVPASENSGIWVYNVAGGSLVAQTGEESNPAPGTGGAVFTKLGNPVLSSSGELAFLGNFAGGPSRVKPSSGIFVTKSGTTTVFAKIGDEPPGFPTGSGFATFEELAVENGGGVAFLATAKGVGVTAKDNLGLWASDSSGTLQLVARKGEPLPLPAGGTGEAVSGLGAFKPLGQVDGQGRSIDTLGGNFAFLAKAKAPADNVLEVAVASGAFTVSNAASVGGAVPDSAFTVKSIDEPIVNRNGSLAFRATLAGRNPRNDKPLGAADDTGIVLVTAAGRLLVAQTGVTAAPDGAGSTATGAVFSKLSDPVLDNGDRCGFVGTLEAGIGDTLRNGTNDTGVWTNSGGVLERVARKGDAAPGTNGRFAGFQQLVLADVGGAVFTASLSGVPAAQARGLWAVDSQGALSLIVQEGNTLNVNAGPKTVKTFAIFQLPSGVFGQSRSFDAPSENLVYLASFTDGTTGIFEVLSP